MSEHLRKLPKVDRVLAHPRLRELALARSLVRRFVVDAIEVERARVLKALAQGQAPSPAVADEDALAARVRTLLDELLRPHPRVVLNGTGVLLHTNVGRAPLSEAARAAVVDAAGTCDLELELETGKRGSRLTYLRPLLAALLEAEDAHVVNNGAAALLLSCTALTGTQDAAPAIVLSRGQHVEIGDSFRVAEMAAAAGVPVIPVGSTNRTHLHDYAAALDRWPGAALLWVHQSNFVQAGFVSEVGLAELATLARAHEVPLIADLGSGSLGLGFSQGLAPRSHSPQRGHSEGLAPRSHSPQRGLAPNEPTVASYLRAGATIVTFSGDKLLGGPQAGLLAGEASAIARCRKHPLARALRCGKLALAAIHATVIAHAQTGEGGVPDLPLHQMLAVDLEQLRARGLRLCAALGWSQSCVRDSQATIGGGSLPGMQIASMALVAPCEARAGAAKLRAGEPPMLARVHDEQLWIDLRTLHPVDDAQLLAALRAIG